MSEENFSTDSTNHSNKEKEKIISYFGNHIKYEYSFNDELPNEKNEFKEPDHKLNWNYSDNNTFHFKQDIERIWMIVKNFELLSLINYKGYYPIILVKGKHTWKVGNIFKGNILGKLPFIAKVSKCVNYPEFKKIDWIVYLKNDYYFNIRLELYKVTEDNSTVLLKKVNFEKLELKQEIHMFLKNSENKTLEKIEYLLEKEPINLLKYERGIITGKMEDIWNIVLDFNKIIAIAPNNNYLPNIDINNLKIGEKKEVSVFHYNKISYFDITLKCRQEKKGWNKWLFVIEASGGRPNKIARHTVLFQLTKINNNECQLTLLTKYHDAIDNDTFNKLSKCKKYIILSLKDYFDNFYCPCSSNY